MSKYYTTCSQCGCEIHEGDEYWEVLDNYLQADYFDGEKHVFCCPQCVLDNITCESREHDGTWGEWEEEEWGEE